MTVKIEYCTSCGSQEIEVTGNKFYCPDCDITYKVTAQGTKVVDSNPLGKEKARLDQLEDDVAELKGKKKPETEPAGPKPGGKDDVNYHGDKNEEDEDEQDGFITFEK